VIAPLLGLLNTSTRLTLPILRTLNAIAESVAQFSTERHNDDVFIKELYATRNIASLVTILENSSPSLVVQQEVSLAAALITKTCKYEAQRRELARAGVLEVLATRLASFIVATCPNTQCDIQPATTRSRLAPILHIITILISSKTRARQFVCAPAFASLFPDSEVDPWKEKKYPGDASDTSLSRKFRSDFPQLAGNGFWGKKTPKSYSSALDFTPTDAFHSPEDENPLIVWLSQVVQVETGVTRLFCIFVLFQLSSCTGGRRREREMSLRLMPVLVRMLDDDRTLLEESSGSYDSTILQPPEWLIMEWAPTILASLVVDNPESQQAAFDAGAIKKLSQLLKQSFDPISEDDAEEWDPDEVQPPSAKFGEDGISPEFHHILQLRQGVLLALAAMAMFKDELRKAIIDSGVVQFIIDSLRAHGTDRYNSDREGRQVRHGNPDDVLISACSLAKALSRSVSTLRTSLIDAGLTEPLYMLLTHRSVDVQIAATAVVCNLVLEFSPMREVSFGPHTLHSPSHGS
jgi:hypothetical protein